MLEGGASGKGREALGESTAARATPRPMRKQESRGRAGTAGELSDETERRILSSELAGEGSE